MEHPPYTPAERDARGTFLALMWALSYPGRVHLLPEMDTPSNDQFVQIGESLLDLETSFYTPDATLGEMLTRTGAQAQSPRLAHYHFYPAWTGDTLAAIEQANVGTMLRPDESATLFIACQFDEGVRLRWRGPGIQEHIEVRIGGVPADFWQLREATNRYPLGWDVYLLDGERVLGLPRTIIVEMVEG